MWSDPADHSGKTQKPETKVCDGCKKRLNGWSRSTCGSSAWERFTADEWTVVKENAALATQPAVDKFEILQFKSA